jgi:hypothetical protein
MVTASIINNINFNNFIFHIEYMYKYGLRCDAANEPRPAAVTTSERHAKRVASDGLASGHADRWE